MPRSENVDFNEEGFAAVQRDIRDLFLLAWDGSHDLNQNASSANQSDTGSLVPVVGGGTGLTSITANTFLYGAATNVYAETPLTSYSRSLLADTTAVDWRSGLGLGSLAVLSSLALDDLSDVTITAVATRDFVRFTGTAWVNESLGAIKYSLSSNVLALDGGALVAGSATTVSVDKTGSRLMIGSNSSLSFQLSGDFYAGTDASARIAWVTSARLSFFDSDGSEVLRWTVDPSVAANRKFDFLTTKLAGSNVAFTGGVITGITDLAIADGGTGASTAAAARANLGSTTVGDAVFIAATTAAARSAIGAVIGTNVQAWDADLDAIAALVSAADKLPYATGAQTWALTDLTTFGRSLIDDANAATARGTLGLGTFSLLNSLAIGSLSDVTITAAATGDYLRYSGTAWADYSLGALTYTAAAGSAPNQLALDGGVGVTPATVVGIAATGSRIMIANGSLDLLLSGTVGTATDISARLKPVSSSQVSWYDSGTNVSDNVEVLRWALDATVAANRYFRYLVPIEVYDGTSDRLRISSPSAAVWRIASMATPTSFMDFLYNDATRGSCVLAKSDWDLGGQKLYVNHSGASPGYLVSTAKDEMEFVAFNKITLKSQFTYVGNSGGSLGFFTTATVATKQVVSAPSAITVAGTAVTPYGTNERDMINALKTDVTNLRSFCNTLYNALVAYNLIS